MSAERLAGSFRDPSGFVFRRNGVLYRQVQERYAGELARLDASGLHEELVADGLLVPHEIVDSSLAAEPGAARVLRPEPLPFISYPYEWSFSQLRDAARLTLEVHRRALSRGFKLKDASAYNVQFRHGTPILIDWLSFETYEEGRPWVAYRQFCQHFVAPLALMSKRDVRLGLLLRDFIDGIPLDLTASLLPPRTHLSFGLQVHLHAHARAERHVIRNERRRAPIQHVSLRSHLHFVQDLERTVRKLDWDPPETVWSDYDERGSYTAESLSAKEDAVARCLEAASPRSVWDLGAHAGRFSRIASDRGIFTVAWDFDSAAVERNYRRVRDRGENHMLPLVLDLTNPSPALGWECRERSSFEERGPVDLVMALALVHHLAITNNIPLPRLAAFLARLGRHALVEFVPKEDPRVRELLADREDIFPTYTEEDFEAAFSHHFDRLERTPLTGSARTLYLWRSRDVR